MKFYRVKNKAGEVAVIADRDLVPGLQVLGEFDHPANAKPKVEAKKVDKPAVPAGCIRIKDPKRPGAFLVLAERDFDETQHERFVQAPAKVPVPPTVDPTPAQDEKPEPVVPANSKAGKK